MKRELSHLRTTHGCSLRSRGSPLNARLLEDPASPRQALRALSLGFLRLRFWLF